MDLTTDEDIAMVTTCFDNWKAGKIKNQSVEFRMSRNNDLIHIRGQKTFEEGMELWRNLDVLGSPHQLKTPALGLEAFWTACKGVAKGVSVHSITPQY
jgi:hypothetical protein